MIKRIANSITHRLNNYFAQKKDLRINKKIIVFESDDWSSIRVPSCQVYDAMLSDGYAMNMRPFERFDCLESDEDIKRLSDVLLKYSDSKGNHPVITLNYLSANPDFKRIKDSNFENYSYELVQDTYAHTEGSYNVIRLVKEGIENGVFYPQCHGREHFNIPKWMSSLNECDKDVLYAFNHGMCGIFPKDNPSLGNKYMVALRSNDYRSQKFVCDAVDQSLHLFESLWGYKSSSFIAPCYTWNDKIEKILAENGVHLLQSARIQRVSDSSKLIFRSIGERNRYGQIYSIRNCSFEPSLSNQRLCVDSCISEIRKAFNSGAPAVISVHRINFSSGIVRNNRDRNLELLDNLLSNILSEFADVEFLNSAQLLEYLQ